MKHADLAMQLQRLLKSAQDALQQCTLLIDRDQLDMAYVFYLRACEITVNIIPRHLDHRQSTIWSDLMLVRSLSVLHPHLELGVPRHFYPSAWFYLDQSLC